MVLTTMVIAELTLGLGKGFKWAWVMGHGALGFDFVQPPGHGAFVIYLPCLPHPPYLPHPLCSPAPLPLDP